MTGRLAQGLEVGPDLAIRLSVVHRLEGRGGHEQEGHAGLGRHGFGHVRLARPGWAFEEDGPSCRPAHALFEGAVGEEQVERLDDLIDDDARALDISEPNVDVARPEKDMGGSPGTDQRTQDGNGQQSDKEDRRQVHPGAVWQMGEPESHRAAAEKAQPQEARDEEKKGEQSREPTATAVLTGLGDVGATGKDDVAAPECFQVGVPRRLHRRPQFLASSSQDGSRIYRLQKVVRQARSASFGTEWQSRLRCAGRRSGVAIRTERPGTD